jgi:HemY protein
MKTVLWLLLGFAAAVAAVTFGRVGQGYVVFVHPPYRVEVSLLFFAVLILASFAALYAAMRFVHHALSLPAYVRAFRARRRRARGQAAFAAALQDLFEGRYARAEKEAALAHDLEVWPGLAALVAARATHQMRQSGKRDDWLGRAAQAGSGIQSAKLITQAEFALEERDFAGARDALMGLHGTGPRHIATLRMLMRAERGVGEWEETLRLVEQLAKRDAITPAVAEEYRVQATVEVLARAAGRDRAAFEERLRRVPSRDKLHPRVASVAARHAGELGAFTLARDVVEKALAAEWSATLLRRYSDIGQTDQPQRGEEARVRIERAEKWLREHPEDPDLLAALGRLCVHAELWGKAQSFLEASLSFGETRAAHLDLARLMERLGHDREAQTHYRRAAELP